MRVSYRTRSWRLLTALAAVLALSGIGTVSASADETGTESLQVPEPALLLPGQSHTATITEQVDTLAGVQEWVYTVTDTVGNDPEAEAEENPDGIVAAAAVRCWQHHKNIRATSLGITQYRWQHLVRWCFKGDTPHKVNANQGNNLGVGSFWNWRGNSRSDASKSSSAFYRYRQGHYQLCHPQPVGCWQNGYPAHSASYGKGGAVRNQRTWVR